MKRSSMFTRTAALFFPVIILCSSPTVTHSQSPADFFQAFEDFARAAGKIKRQKDQTKRADPEVRRLQAGLGRLGYYKGEFDGLYGRNTDRAVRLFLADQDISPDDDRLDLDWLVAAVERKAPEVARTGDPAESENGDDQISSSNWISDYAQARGGCDYYSHVLFHTQAPDGSSRDLVSTDYFGKDLSEWTEDDLKLLQEAYIGECKAGDDDYVTYARTQFVADYIPALRLRITGLKAQAIEKAYYEAANKLREDTARQAQAQGQTGLPADKPDAPPEKTPEERQQEIARRERERGENELRARIWAEVQTIEASLSPCEQKIEKGCYEAADLALTQIKNWSRQAMAMAGSGDLPRKIQEVENKVVDLRTRAREVAGLEPADGPSDNCDPVIGGISKTDPALDKPITWPEHGFTLRNYLCLFSGTDVLHDVEVEDDETVSFFLDEIKVTLEPLAIPDSYAYGRNLPTKVGGILALTKLEKGDRRERYNNSDAGVRIMLGLVQIYARLGQ